MWSFPAIAALACWVIPYCTAQAQGYLTDIKPILQARCYACHGVLKQEGELRLDTGAALRSATDNGAVVLERISSSDEELRMPPIGEPLTLEEIDKFKQWVAGGAESPANESAESDPADQSEKIGSQNGHPPHPSSQATRWTTKYHGILPPPVKQPESDHWLDPSARIVDGRGPC